jgi:hypothetical protein
VTLGSRLRRASVKVSKAWHRWHPDTRASADPPPCPPGWHVGPPDFVGIGAQKAGTSWWSALLREHPEVRRASDRPKEMHYFDQFWERPWTSGDATRYASWFPRPHGAVAGEWTPGYMVDFWTPELIARAAPDARLLVLLRDPVDRFRSGLTHTDSTRRTDLMARDMAGAFQRGLYAQQLRRVFDVFPRDRVLVLQYEACRAGPSAELSRTFRFLGLADVTIDPARLRQEVNPTTSRKAELSEALVTALREGYATDLEELTTLVPDLDLSRWPTATQNNR